MSDALRILRRFGVTKAFRSDNGRKSYGLRWLDGIEHRAVVFSRPTEREEWAEKAAAVAMVVAFARTLEPPHA